MFYKVSCGVLALATITLGVLFGLNTKQLDDANLTNASLNSRVLYLDSQVLNLNSQVSGLNNKVELLNSQISGLQTSVNDLTAKRDSLSAQLVAANSQNSTLTSQLADTNTKLTASNSQLTDARSQLTTTQSQLLATQALLTASNSSVTNLQVQIANMQSGYGYVLNDTTYNSVKAFIASDPTDRNVYKDISFGVNTYNCVNFAFDVVKNAAIQHIRCAYVNVDIATGGHALVAFNTTDRGIVFIEPQDDYDVNLTVGTHYWQSVIIPSGQHYSTPTYDDTVVRFVVIW